ASSSEMSSLRWRTRRSSSLSIRVSMSKTANAIATMLGRGKNFHQPDGHRQALLADNALRRAPAEADRLEGGIEGPRVGAAGVGEERAPLRGDPACEGRRERTEQRAVVEQLGHEDDVEARAHDRAGRVRDDEAGVDDLVRGGA